MRALVQKVTLASLPNKLYLLLSLLHTNLLAESFNETITNEATNADILLVPDEITFCKGMKEFNIYEMKPKS